MAQRPPETVQEMLAALDTALQQDDDAGDPRGFVAGLVVDWLAWSERPGPGSVLRVLASSEEKANGLRFVQADGWLIDVHGHLCSDADWQLGSRYTLVWDSGVGW